MSNEGLIDPSKFPVPETSTFLLDWVAAKLKTDGTDLADAGHDITGAWAGLDGIYTAPESETLFSVLNPVSSDGEEVSSALSSASEALIEFAEKVRGIKGRWDTLKSDATTFLESIDYGRDEDWDEGSGMLWWKEESPKIGEHNDLIDRAAGLQHEFEEAERTCANAITSLFGGTTFIAQKADGSVKPESGEFVYGFDAPLEGVDMGWGVPQTTDYAWYTDATDAVGDYVVGMAEDLGGMVGAHGPDGWFSGSWGDNLWDYWGGTVEGLGSLVGVSKDENGNWGFSLETAGNAWKEAAHSVVPWREWGDRPWYVIGTGLLNVGATVGGALLTATGVGAVVGVPLLAWRGSRMLDGVNGGRTDADLPNADGADLDSILARVPRFGDGSITPVDLSELADLDIDAGSFGRMDEALQRLNNSTGGNGADPDLPGNTDGRRFPVTDTDTEGNGSAPRTTPRSGDEPEGTEQRRTNGNGDDDGADQDADEPTYPTTELLDSSQDFLDGVDPESVRGLREGMDGQENDWVTSQVPNDISSVDDAPVQRYEGEPSRVEAEADRPEELVRVGNGEYEIAEGADGNRVDARNDSTVGNSAGGDRTEPLGEQEGTGRPASRLPDSGDSARGPEAQADGPRNPPPPPEDPPNGPGDADGDRDGDGDGDGDDSSEEPGGTLTPDPRRPEYLAPNDARMDPDLGPRVLEALKNVPGVRQLNINEAGFERIITNLTNKPQGGQIADMILNEPFDRMPGFKDIVSDLKNGRTIGSRNQEMRLALDLHRSGVAPERIEFRGKDPVTGEDLDVAVVDEHGNTVRGYQAYIPESDTIDPIKTAMKKFNKQLPLNTATENQVGVMELPMNRADLLVEDMARMEEFLKTRRSDLSVHLHFQDGTVVLPEGTQIYKEGD